MKKISLLLLAMLLLTMLSVFAETSPKDEIVYMKLGANGDLQSTYIVNKFTEKGQLKDLGNYSEIINLSNEEKIKANDGKISFVNNDVVFYYQGNLKKAKNPWQIKINYFLNQKPIKAQELAGKSGEIKLKIAIRPNKNGRADIAENFVLQSTINLETAIISDLKSSEKNIAYNGKNTVITSLLLPNTKRDIELSFNAVNFRLEPMTFSAIPFHIDLDADIPDLKSTKSDIIQLKNGINELKNNYSLINNGIDELDTNFDDLKTGSNQFLTGLNDLNSHSTQLKQTSAKILAGLDKINQALETAEQADSGVDSVQSQLTLAFSQLQTAYQQFDGGLNQYLVGVDEIANSYPQINTGISEVKKGTIELNNGSSLFYDGISEVDSKLAETDISFLDDMEKMTFLNKHNYQLKSFASIDNTNIGIQEFVMRTLAIEKEEKLEPQNQEIKKLSLWEKLRNLFE